MPRHRHRAVWLMSLAAIAGCREEDPLGDLGCPIGLTCPDEAVLDGVGIDARDPGIEAFFQAIVDLRSQAMAQGDAIDTSLGRLVELHGIEPESSSPGSWAPEIAVAIEADLAAHLDGPLEVRMRPPRCTVSDVAGRKLWLACMGSEANEFDAGLACQGECRVLGPGACPSSGSLACEGVASDCPGVCEGSCRMDDGGACGGRCLGSCDGECDRLSPGGQCIGHCTGSCTGRCDQDVGGSCPGECEGSCRWTPGDSACPADATLRCEDPSGVAACAGPCRGGLTAPQGSPSCAVAAVTRSVIGARCEPAKLEASYRLQDGLDPEDAARFRGRLDATLREFEVLANHGHPRGGAPLTVQQSAKLIEAAAVDVKAEIEAAVSTEDLRLQEAVALGCALGELGAVVDVMSYAQARVDPGIQAYDTLAGTLGVVEVEGP